MKIFLSYAKEDGAIVKEFHDYLKALGFDPWMDQEQLLPGHVWEREIEKALSAANVVILFISPRSVKKRSFVTREANQAVANLRYKKADDIYIIPVLIEPCEVPEEIAGRAQYAEISAPGAKSKIVSALKQAAEQQGIAINQGAEHGPFQVSTLTFVENKAGRPGHEISIEFPQFISPKYPAVAQELSDFFKGRSAQIVLKGRSTPWNQMPDIFPDSDSELSSYHANGRWDTYSVQYASEHLVSVYYNCSWYGAGAMHGHEFHEGFNFRLIDGKAYPFELEDLFTDKEVAAQILSTESRRLLAEEYWKRSGEKIDVDKGWHEDFLASTEADLSKFSNFTIGDGKITLYFPPYSIAAYAFGSFVIDVSFYHLIDVMKRGDETPIPHELIN